MKFPVFITLLLVSLCSFAQTDGLTITVHPGVELLTIVQKLSGQYPRTTDSQYEHEMWAYFGKYAGHPAVQKIKTFKGRLYPDLTELGFCFSDFPVSWAKFLHCCK